MSFPFSFRIKKVRWQTILPVLALFGFLTFLSSCDRRSCKDVQCAYRQTCVNGECVCPNGYEGDNCDIRSQEKFIGQYQVFKNCYQSNPGPNNYYTSINPGANVENVVITDIIGNGQAVEAVVRGKYIEVPEQNMGATQISGTGNYQEGSQRIDMQIQYTQGGNAHSCDLSFHKQ